MRRAFLVLALFATSFATLQDPKPNSQPTGPAAGKPALAFRVNDHTGTAVRIGGPSDAWTVLAFYPMAATPG